jgi:hypothetical protein
LFSETSRMQITNQTIEFKLTPLLPWQQVVDASSAQVKVIRVGRRGGKSKYCGQKIALAALETQLPYAWFVPTFRNAKLAWVEMTELARQLGKHAKIFKDEFLIEFPKTRSNTLSAGYMQVISVADPDNTRGMKAAGVVCDEAAYIQERAYTQVIQPCLLDYDGWTLMPSTPCGYNWFHNQYLIGTRREEGYESFHFTSYDNTSIPNVARQLDRLKRLMTPDAFEQEIMAEFRADALSVFRHVVECIVHDDPPREPLPGHDYVMGVDWGRKHDYTAICIMDEHERREVVMEHFSGVGFGLQAGRIQALYELWRPHTVVAEENGIGMANVERLQDMGLPVIAFKMQQASKKMLVEKLALATERIEIDLLADDWANGELQAFQETISAQTGNIKYGAPEGGHDDTVVARMLAWNLISEELGDPMVLEW